MNVWNGANPRTLLHRLLQENSKLRETIKRLESSAARETVTRLESSAASERNRKRTRVPDDDDDDGEYVG